MKTLLTPQIALGAEEVTVGSWLIDPGDGFDAGQPIIEIETDKASMEIEAPFAGILVARLHEAGEIIAVGAPYGYAVEPHEDAQAAMAEFAAGGTARSDETSNERAVSDRDGAHTPVRAAGSLRSAPTPPAAGTLIPFVVVHDGELAGLPAETAAIERPKAAIGEAQRRIASSRMLDDPAAAGQYRERPLTRRRLAISRRMAAAASIPAFSVDRDIGIDAAQNAVTAARVQGHQVTLTDFLLKACSHAARQHPAANAWVIGELALEFERVSIALAVDTSEGVLAPVIRGVESLTIEEIAERRADLVARSREFRLHEQELLGATLSLSNVAGLGSHRITPVLTAPQAVAVGVGSARVTPEGALVTATFVGDHRLLDGADGARFLAALAEALAAA